MNEAFSEEFLAVTDYVQAVEGRSISHAEGCWERDVTGVWSVALNPHDSPCECRGVEVAPFHCAVFWREHLAGILNPYGGAIVAHQNANEDLFIEAMKAATKGAKR